MVYILWLGAALCFNLTQIHASHMLNIKVLHSSAPLIHLNCHHVFVMIIALPICPQVNTLLPGRFVNSMYRSMSLALTHRVMTWLLSLWIQGLFWHRQTAPISSSCLSSPGHQSLSAVSKQTTDKWRWNATFFISFSRWKWWLSY